METKTKSPPPKQPRKSRALKKKVKKKSDAPPQTRLSLLRLSIALLPRILRRRRPLAARSIMLGREAARGRMRLILVGEVSTSRDMG
jgi:hypothetical protein